MEFLDCQTNNITILDLSGKPLLTNLYCWSNSLTSLDVSECTALQHFHCWDNLIPGTSCIKVNTTQWSCIPIDWNSGGVTYCL